MRRVYQVGITSVELFLFLGGRYDQDRQSVILTPASCTARTHHRPLPQDIYSLFHLDRPFKFISKTSIFMIPIVGWSMFLTGKCEHES